MHSSTTPLISKIISVFSNLNYLTLVVTIIIALIGWIFALWSQKNNAKNEHRIQVRYDIYKLLLKHSQDVHMILSKVNAVSPPLILMKSQMISYDLKLKKEVNGDWLPYSEMECVFEGNKIWSAFTKELIGNYFEYTNKYIEMLFAFEGWESALEPLINTKQILVKEISNYNISVYKEISKLQMFENQHGHDWRKWNEKEIEIIEKNIRDSVMTIGSYISDFMLLVHNELLSEYFKYKKPIRKTLDPAYKVLTSEGLVTSLEDDYEKKLSEFIKENEG